MADAILVTDDIESGRLLLQELDKAKFPYRAAAWVYNPDTERWKLVIATPDADVDLQKALMAVLNAIKAGPLTLNDFDLARVRLVSPDFFHFKKPGQIAHTTDQSPMRYSGYTVNGVYIYDSLIYKLAA